MRRKRNIGAECECIANSMVTFLKFLLTYSMKFVKIYSIRDRPFNLKGGLWFFVSFRHFFSDNTRVRIFIIFVAQSANFFSRILTLGYMTKTLNQIIIFFLHQNQNIFFSNIGNQNIFLEKNHNHPLQVKWSFPKHKVLHMFAHPRPRISN